jgi:hypothetical protein
VSEPYAVLVLHVEPSTRPVALSAVSAYGPFDEDEADAFATRLRKDFDLRARAVRLQGWSGAHEAAMGLRR